MLPADADALIRAALAEPARTGAASTCASAAGIRCCAWSSALMNLALAPDRHRHRRPGDLRAPRAVRAGRRLSRPAR
ncbi:MAG: hypothetical protein MZW92_81380 [Comamonadaceae bacterium]|nr:hypothetical protein [Comamonadaceae bacterium]